MLQAERATMQLVAGEFSSALQKEKDSAEEGAKTRCAGEGAAASAAVGIRDQTEDEVGKLRGKTRNPGEYRR